MGDVIVVDFGTRAPTEGGEASGPDRHRLAGELGTIVGNLIVAGDRAALRGAHLRLLNDLDEAHPAMQPVLHALATVLDVVAGAPAGRSSAG